VKEIERQLKQKMTDVIEQGNRHNYTQEQYRAELKDIIQQERKILKSGHRALNKNKRNWADQ
jgi:hypothetical protein